MTNVKNDRKKLALSLMCAIIVIVASLFGVYNSDDINQQPSSQEEKQQTQQEIQKPEVSQEGEMILTMIDVGQADSFLFMQDGKTALIDCGTVSTGKDVVAYLKKQGITKLDYVFGTHPHEDHMGGMYEVITNFDVETVVIPEVTKNPIVRAWYTKLMKELKSSKYNVVYPKVNDEFVLGDATMKVLGPFEEPDENLNNYSTVMMVSFGEMDVLMTGDAESDVEREILNSGVALDAEILKVGHHGSSTSTCNEFLHEVTPDYALISAELDNRYNHPVKKTMDKLKKRNIDVYRTDENGTVVMVITTDGVEFNTNPGDYLSGTELSEREKK